MKIHWQILILFTLVSCSENETAVPDGGAVDPHEREMMDIVCPVHQVPVFKVHASCEISCYVWDPRLGLTVEQIRNRFPYAIWDSNLHRIDESEGAKFPRYNLVCDRCRDSWGEYAASNPLPPERGLVISITESQKILIDDTEFSLDQIPAVAKMVSSHQAKPRLHIRATNSTPIDLIKAVVNACATEGITDVIFGSYVEPAKSTQLQSAKKAE